MLTTERMRKISVIIHVRRLAQLLAKLGEANLLQIIRKEPIFLRSEILQQTIIQDLEKIHKLQEKINKITTIPPGLEIHPAPEKYSLQGTSIGDILQKMTLDIDECYEQRMELEAQINDLNNQWMILVKTQEFWKELLSLNVDFTRLKGLENIVLVRIGYIRRKEMSFFRRALNKVPHLFYERRLDKENNIFLISSLQKYREQIFEIERAHHVTIIQNIHEIHPEGYQIKIEKLEKLKTKLDELNQEVLKFLKKEINLLLAYKEILENLERISRVESNLEHTSHFVTIEGWVAVSRLEEFIDICNKITENTALIVTTEEYENKEPPPSKFKHNRIIKVFEVLTRLYGYPNYKEIDPTVIIAFTFPLLFGFMFGDVGHGLMLLIGGIGFYLWKKNEEGTWKKLSRILIIAAISSIIVGFLYGDFFGQSEVLGWTLHPILFNPFEDMIEALKFSILIGVIILSIGILIDGINAFLQSRREDFFLFAIPRLFIFCGTVYLIFSYGFQFDIWFKGPILIVLIPAIILVFGKPLIHVLSFSKFYSSESTIQLFGSGILEGWETFISCMSNIPSFGRIFALSLAHIGLVEAITLLANISGSVLGVIILVIGHIGVVLFEILIVFIHDLRLHYYEFFGKFFKGDGSQFTPFNLPGKFSNISFIVPTKGE
ncbi:MAG: V-type ATP synthase subunit I [Candidatus Helarchaeota archaeon]